MNGVGCGKDSAQTLYSAIKKRSDIIMSLWDPGFLPFLLRPILQTLNQPTHKTFYL